MANLSITPAQVIPQTDPARAEHIVAPAVTIVAGDVLYIDTNREWQKAAANVGVDEAQATHLALNNGAAGQFVTGALLQSGLVVTLGADAAPVQGLGYWLSATAGAHAPEVDLLTGEYATFLGVGIGNNQVQYGVVASGKTKP